MTQLFAELEAAELEFEIVLAENGSRDATVAIAERPRRAVCRPAALVLVPRAQLRRGPARGDLPRPRRVRDLRGDRPVRRRLPPARARAAALRRGRPGDRQQGDGRRPRPAPARPPDRDQGLQQAAAREPGFSGTDTHGLKAMRRAAVAPIAARCIVDYDVFASELVIRAEREGLRVLEIPVEIDEKRALDQPRPPGPAGARQPRAAHGLDSSGQGRVRARPSQAPVGLAFFGGLFWLGSRDPTRLSTARRRRASDRLAQTSGRSPSRERPRASPSFVGSSRERPRPSDDWPIPVA